MIKETHLKKIMPQLSNANCALYLPHIQKALIEYEINTPRRAAAFLAQIAHETMQLQFLAEIWGPTDEQKKYDPPGAKAHELGNIQQGDGRRYKGRGAIQITGRANYERFGKLLGLNLVSTPEKAAAPEVAFRTAGAFWTAHGLNDLADKGDIKGITRRINGGQNGETEREKYYVVACSCLADEVAIA